jgi:hypothetical protein
MLTVTDMSIYEYHICATGALHVSSIESKSASLDHAALTDGPDVSTSYSSGTPSTEKSP